jgi:hypothetical protein
MNKSHLPLFLLNHHLQPHKTPNTNSHTRPCPGSYTGGAANVPKQTSNSGSSQSNASAIIAATRCVGCAPIISFQTPKRLSGRLMSRLRSSYVDLRCSTDISYRKGEKKGEKVLFLTILWRQRCFEGTDSIETVLQVHAFFLLSVPASFVDIQLKFLVLSAPHTTSTFYRKYRYHKS